MSRESRLLLAVIGVSFLISGLVDALLGESAVKILVLHGIWLLMLWLVVHEIMWSPVPDNPLIESAVLITGILCGAMGLHPAAYLIASIVLGRTIEDWIQLSSGYYMPRSVLIPLSVAMSAIYLFLLFIVGKHIEEK